MPKNGSVDAPTPAPLTRHASVMIRRSDDVPHTRARQLPDPSRDITQCSSSATPLQQPGSRKSGPPRQGTPALAALASAPARRAKTSAYKYVQVRSTSKESSHPRSGAGALWTFLFRCSGLRGCHVQVPICDHGQPAPPAYHAPPSPKTAMSSCRRGAKVDE